MTAASLPKPRVIHVGTDTWFIDFGIGAEGLLQREPDEPRDRWCWRVELPDGETRVGHSYGDRVAFDRMWCLAAQSSAPASVVSNDIEIARMSKDIRTSRAIDAAKVLRAMLKKRTGFAWSVRVGSGTSASTIRISSMPRRRADGCMSAHDTALLAAVLGEDHVSRSGVTIADLNARVSSLRAIIGPQQAMAVAL